MEKCPYCLSENIYFSKKRTCYICEDCEKSFLNTYPEGEDKDPQIEVSLAKPNLNIFISYPHTHTEKCEMIMKELEKRGHNIWFDKTKLHHGVDWRREIADGISKSDLVLSFLTQSALRSTNNSRGVCLDELSIAASTPGCKILTVLLEPESVVKPNASLSHRQWLDMSAWDTTEQQGAEYFDSWFRYKSNQLIEAIESEDNYNFPGEITAIISKLPKANNQTKPSGLLSKEYYGREWLSKILDNWIDDPNGKSLCVIYGPPGIGKSTFTAHYAFSNSRVAAMIYCSYGNMSFNTPSAIIQSIAYQIACRLPDYRAQLLSILSKDEVSDLSDQEMLEKIIIRPLTEKHIDGGQEHLCVVIDGIDECGSAEINPMVSLVSDFAEKVPNWLRILILSRSESVVLDHLSSAKTIYVAGDDANNLSDIKSFLREQLEEEIDEQEIQGIIDLFAEQSGGIFLYASKIIESIKAKTFDFRNKQSYPHGLNDIFQKWFDRFFPDINEYKQKFRDAIGAIVFYPCEFPKDELIRIFSMTEGESEDFLRRIQVIIRKTKDVFGESAISIDHKYIYDWITQEAAGKYRVYKNDSFNFIKNNCLRLILDQHVSPTKSEALFLPEIVMTLQGNSFDYKRLMVNPEFARCQLIYGTKQNERGNLSIASDYFKNYLYCSTLRYETDKDLESCMQITCALDINGDIKRKFSELSEALSYYIKSLTIREEMCRLYNESWMLRDAACSHRKIGNIFKIQSDNKHALEHYLTCQKICEKLLDEDEENIDYKQDLSIALRKVANILLIDGDIDAAEKLYTQSLAIILSIVSQRGSIGDRRDLSVAYERQGDIFRKKGLLESALNVYQQCVELREEIKNERGFPSDLEDLAVGYRKFANILREMKEYSEALAVYNKSIELRNSISSFHETKSDLQELAVCYRKIANILSALKNDDAALEYHFKSKELVEKLVAERGLPGDWRDLSVCFERIGDILFQKSSFGEANVNFHECLTIRLRLIQIRGFISDYYDLASVYERFCGLYKAQSMYDEQKMYAQKLIDTCECIIQRKPGEEKAKKIRDAMMIEHNAS